MKLLLIASLVAYVSAYGVDQCSWGPSHWCSSLKNAKQCSAVKHCIGTVWSNTELKDDTSDVCGFCENIIKDVKGFVTDNQTEAMVRDYMDNACALIPVQELADACKEALDDDIGVFFDLISAELDPKAICTAISLCQGFDDLTIHEQAKQKVPVLKINDVTEPKVLSDLCPECMTIVNEISKMVADNETIVHVDDILKTELCAQLGALKDECEDLVTLYVPQIVETISQAINADQICGALGMCPNGDLLMLVKMKLKESPLYKALTNAQVSTSEECMFCKIIFEELQQLDRNAAVQKDMEDFINTYLCAKLGNYQAVCESTVTQYGQMLFELLATELDPATRCSSIGFCAAPAAISSSQIIRNAMPAAPIQAAKPVPVKTVKSSEGCLICTTVMMEIKNMLESNDTEAELVSDLEKVCSILPDTIKAQCNAFVDAYGPAVIEMLLQELDPTTVCTALGLCGSKAQEQPKQIKKVKGGEMCGICETVIQYLDSILVQNATEQEIMKDMERICNFLPDTIKETCNTLVEEYAVTIIKLVSQGLTPEQVCQEIGLCTATNLLQNALLNDLPIVPVKAEQIKKVEGGEMCGICETVIQYLDSILVQNATEQEIMKDLERICNFLPDTIKETCNTMVEEYAVMIIKLVSQGLTPEQVCQEIGLCTATNLLQNALLNDLPIVPVKAQMVGLNECTFGPSFWCATKENAVRCQAVDHCSKNVWNK